MTDATVPTPAEAPPTYSLPEEPPPSPESFGSLYKLLGDSPVYQQIMVSVYGEGYGRQLSVAGPAEVRLLAARAGLAPSQRVADLGCGMGAPTVQMAAEYGCQVIAVDWSRRAIDICRRSAQDAGVAHRLRFVVGDLGTSLFAGDSFHAVVSVDGFSFGVDLPALYAEVFRVLRPGGRFAFYFNVPTQEVVDASPPQRREHRESHRIDHLAALNAAGFIYTRAEDRTFAELLHAYTTHFEGLQREIGLELATGLRDEIEGTLHVTEHGLWPRYLFSARKPETRPARRR
jgi:ubiquinone/menaquinone biosynthesis C-methylase UbiE